MVSDTLWIAIVGLAMLFNTAATQLITSEQNSARIVQLPNGNSELRESHSDGGSLIPGRSWG